MTGDADPSALDSDASTQLTPDVRRTLEIVMRQDFDGMHNYHKSELSHKRDTVTALLALLSTAIALDAGLIALALDDRPVSGFWGGGIFAAVTVFAVLLVGSAVLKFRADNESWRAFLKEHVAARKRLEVYNLLGEWEKVRGGYGWKFTAAIIIVVGVIVVLAAAAGWLVVAECARDVGGRAEGGAPAPTLGVDGGTETAEPAAAPQSSVEPSKPTGPSR